MSDSQYWPHSRRKKWFGRIFSCVSTNSETTFEMDHINSEPGMISVLLFTHGRTLPYAHRTGLKSEELCKWAAKQCGIPRLFSSLFGLYNKRKDVWYTPARVIDPADDFFIFRLRFHTSMDLTALEEKVVTYMFEQSRYDFHHDKMQGLSTEEALGLMVLDLVRYGREKNIPLHHVCETIRFRDHLPKSLVTNLTVLDRMKLKRKVQKSLETFQEDNREAITFKVMFMVSLMEEKRRWGAEEFETITGDKYLVSAAKGLQTYSLDTKTYEDSLEFEDMIDVLLYPSRNNSQHWVVHINRRNGAPKTFEVDSQYKAESIATLLDGYYRLLVDYYHYLNTDCAPPSLIALLRFRCHGPIPLSVAKAKLQEAAQPEGTFIIRQNPEDYDSYCLTVQMNQGVRNYKICVYEDGKIGLPNQRRFDSIRQFMEHYRESSNSWCLHNTPLRKAVQYKNKEPCLQLLDHSIRQGVPRLPTAEEEPRIEWVPESDMSKRSEWKKLGRGAFTVVYRGEIRKRGQAWFPVALKSPREQVAQSVKDKFSQSVDAIASWKHPYIIRFQGIGGGRTPLLIMEYAQYSTLDKYLKKNQESLRLSHQLTAAVQLINALDYLESRNIVHGNISARNVLVTRPAASQLIVKLGDPMLSVYYHSLPIESDVKMKRVRWTAPELLCTNAESTLASDKWSYGITLWEIMAFGELPCAGLTDKQVMVNYKEGRRLGRPRNCPDAVYKIMEHCWFHLAQNRPPCKCILRDMNTILLISYRDDGLEHMYFEPENPDDPAPISEDDMSAEEDDDDMPTSESSDQVTENGLDHQMEPSTPTPEGAVGGNIISSEDRDNFERDINAKEFSSGPMMRWQFGTQELDHGDVKIDLDRAGQLGQGNFGVVRKGTWQRAEGWVVPVAIKLLKGEDLSSTGVDRKSFEEEIRHMSKCQHKNIVPVYGVVETERNNLQMVMEFVKEGALNNYLRRKKDRNETVSDQTLFLFGQQICQGMAYLGETCHLVHRDLAARNILVASETEVKITDFGLARDFTPEKAYYRMTGRHNILPIKWHSPESIKERKFSVQGDVWSFGVVLWEMFSHGESPNYGQDVTINPDVFVQSSQRRTPPGTAHILSPCYLWHHERLLEF
ncbi:tyrosine-protein kinase JAK2-like [Amphiura filiformis]|uniref:tyrosine-protein kinase JAK2-like n=1 Tax=Amphiura filiformis TaxID=82378 RepID=UPI003B21E646